LRLAHPAKPIREMAVSVFGLVKRNSLQLGMFADTQKKSRLVNSIDTINRRWGAFTVLPARMLKTESYVIDRIGFQNYPQP